MKYQKKPIVTEAIRWDGDPASTRAVQTFVGHAENIDGDVSGEHFYPATLTHPVNDGCGIELVWPFDDPSGARLWLKASHMWAPVDPGDWILKDTVGLRVLSPDAFAITYEPIS